MTEKQDECAKAAVEQLESGSGVVLTGRSGSGKSICAAKVLGEVLRNGENGSNMGVVCAQSQSERDKKNEKKKNVTHIETAQVSQVCGLIHDALEAFCSENQQLPFHQCRADWQRTKKAWLELYPEDGLVPYPRTSMLAYALGTTPIHSLFVKSLVKSVISSESAKRALILCGGSGAEYLAFRCLMEEGEVSASFHVDVIDLHSEWATILQHYRATHVECGMKRRRRQSPTYSFFAMNLLDRSVEESATLVTLVEQADVVLLVYGLTELHDADRKSTGELIQLCSSHLAPRSHMMVIDPMKTCHGKMQWLRRLCGPAIRSVEEHKFILAEKDIQDSSAGKWVEQFGLAYNEDVKLSARVWCAVISSHQTTSTTAVVATDVVPNKLGVVVAKNPEHVSYWMRWLELICPHVNVFGLGVLSESESERQRKSALWHLYGELQESEYSVAVVTLIQLGLIVENPKLWLLFKQADVAVLDSVESFFAFTKQARVDRALAVIQESLPELHRRVVVCSKEKYNLGALSLARDQSGGPPLCLVLAPCVNSQPLLPTSPGCSNPFVDSFGVVVRVCGVVYNTSEREGESASVYGLEERCCGELNAHTRVVVSLEQKPLKDVNRVMSVRMLEDLPGPLARDCQDVVFLVSKKGKDNNTCTLPSHRLEQLAWLALGRLSYLCKFPRKLESDAQVCIHFHDSHSVLATNLN